MDIKVLKYDERLRERIDKIAASNFMKCYQCGMCSSGCPSIDEMDILPNQINMFLMLGQYDRVLESKSIWACVACFECAERCPQGVDLSKINEALRQIKIRRNMDLFNIWEVVGKEELPTIALVASFRKFTA